MLADIGLIVGVYALLELFGKLAPMGARNTPWYGSMVVLAILAIGLFTLDILLVGIR